MEHRSIGYPLSPTPFTTRRESTQDRGVLKWSHILTQHAIAARYRRSLVEQLMQEVATGAAASGRMISDRFIQTMLDYTEKMTPYRTSMKIDYDERRPLEVEAIFGNPLRIATALSVDLPLIGMLYQQLKFLDAKHRRIQEAES